MPSEECNCLSLAQPESSVSEGLVQAWLAGLGTCEVCQGGCRRVCIFSQNHQLIAVE